MQKFVFRGGQAQRQSSKGSERLRNRVCVCFSSVVLLDIITYHKVYSFEVYKSLVALFSIECCF